jgi:hypothetical protein
MEIHIQRDGQQMGPYTLEQINEYLVQGALLATDSAWHEGLPQWVPLNEIAGVVSDQAVTSTPPPFKPPATMAPKKTGATIEIPRLWVIGAGAVVLAVVVLVVVVLWGTFSKKRRESDTVLSPEANIFKNTLGMKFVPVPGTKVLFCIWETRVKDYKAFVAATGSDLPSWTKPESDMLAADAVEWEEAQAFCAWLTKKELAMGKIKAGQRYRLPTDAEWSMAVGLGQETGKSPREKNRKIKDVYPWGKDWPPPKGAGNYYDYVKADRYEGPSPVGSFAANVHGIHDLGGNMWEMCEDTMDPKSQLPGVIQSKVVRGASWHSGKRDDLLSSARQGVGKGYSGYGYGFRCVLTNGQ